MKTLAILLPLAFTVGLALGTLAHAVHQRANRLADDIERALAAEAACEAVDLAAERGDETPIFTELMAERMRAQLDAPDAVERLVAGQ